VEKYKTFEMGKNSTCTNRYLKTLSTEKQQNWVPKEYYFRYITVNRPTLHTGGRLRLKCDGTRAETRFRLLAKRTSPFISAGASVQSTTGSRDVCISCSNAGYTMFRGSVKSIGYSLHSPVSSSLPLPCVTVCHYIFNWTLTNTNNI